MLHIRKFALAINLFIGTKIYRIRKFLKLFSKTLVGKALFANLLALCFYIEATVLEILYDQPISLSLNYLMLVYLILVVELKFSKIIEL